MIRSRCVAAICLVLGAVAGAAVQAQSRAQAIVVQTDGTRWEGKLIEAAAGQQVVLELADGSRRTIKWGDIKDLVVEGAGATGA